MKTWQQAIRDDAVSGSVASILSTAVLGVRGQQEDGTPYAPTNYKLTPPRLQPGFEKRLSSASLFLMYGIFGATLALRGLAASQKERLVH